jgi:integrase
MANYYMGEFFRFLQTNSVDIQKVDQFVINQYAQSLMRQSISNKTYQLKMGFVTMFFKKMGKHFTNKKLPVQTYKHINLIQETDFQKILQYLKDRMCSSHSKQLKAFRDYVLLLSYYITGLRKNEILIMCHKDVFLRYGKPFYKTTIKNGEEIEKEFDYSLLLKIGSLKLMERKSDNDSIFTRLDGASNGDLRKNLAPSSVNVILNKYFKAVTGSNQTVTPHSIRNLSAFAVHDETKDILDTMAHLNHKNLDTTHKYLQALKKQSILYYPKLNRRIGFN